MERWHTRSGSLSLGFSSSLDKKPQGKEAHLQVTPGPHTELGLQATWMGEGSTQ